MRKKPMRMFLSFALAVVMILPVATFTSAAAEDSKYRGVDVSQWQGEINFDQVKSSGIEAVYIRAGEGPNFIDRYFERNYENAKKAKLKYGFYHYVTARNTEEAREQADFFANLIRTKPYDMRAAMDFENLSGLRPAESVEIARAYLKQLEERLGHKPVVYSNAYDAESVWKSHFTDYPLWVADYGVSRPYSIGGWRTWEGFQYSDKGDIIGIRGHVDLDHFRDGIFLEKHEKKAAKKIRHDYSREYDGCQCRCSEHRDCDK